MARPTYTPKQIFVLKCMAVIAYVGIGILACVFVHPMLALAFWMVWLLVVMAAKGAFP